MQDHQLSRHLFLIAGAFRVADQTGEFEDAGVCRTRSTRPLISFLRLQEHVSGTIKRSPNHLVSVVGFSIPLSSLLDTFAGLFVFDFGLLNFVFGTLEVSRFVVPSPIFVPASLCS